MIPALASFVLSGLVAFGMLFSFLALVPRVVVGRSTALSVILQFFLIGILVLPAVAVAYYGPSWLYEAPFGQVATKDQRLWLIVGGIALFCGCAAVALRSSAGKQYSKWRGRPPNTSFERTRGR